MTNGENVKTRCVIVGLGVFVAVITTLTLAFSIWVIVQHQVQKQTCFPKDQDITDIDIVGPQTNMTEDWIDGQNVQAQIHLDYLRQIQTLQYSSSENFIDGTIIVIDYKTSLTGIYIPAVDICFVIGGVDYHIQSPFKKMGTPETHNKEIELRYEKARDYPILNPSALPQNLRTRCEGKDIYWLEKTLTGTGRGKRRTKVPIRVKVGQIKIGIYVGASK